MCRYATTNYSSHFACFDCRKAFKKTSIADWTRRKGLDDAFRRFQMTRGREHLTKLEAQLGTTLQGIFDAYLADVSKCPQCDRRMAAMGLDFRAPKMNDVEAWEIVQALYDHGFAFQGCGCDVGYAPPEKRSGLDDYFREHERKSDGLRLLASFRSART